MNAHAEVKARILRCAVYTRKSSDEGLEQSFNSLHAQREACEAYIKSQVSEGWVLHPAAYDDGGISGGTMDRAGLKQLLADIAKGLVDVVVVYKVDRLTRALGDFARIVETFDKHGVSFVSVTQAFNTTTSMGRLTLNVLLSFAQFEREVTGERIRDKLAMSKAKGMWMGSVPPLGYDRGDHVLVVNEPEAETVRSIFQRYLELGSVHALCAELKARDIRSKRWETEAGKLLGDAVISRGALFYLLQNRHYLGQIPHNGMNHPGLHAAIIPADLFAAVQQKLADNRVVRRKRAVKAASHALTGKVFDGEGRRFSPTFSGGRQGRIHRYYVRTDIQLGKEAPAHPDAIRRIGADALEGFALAQLQRLLDRPLLALEGCRDCLERIEVRPADTHFVIPLATLHLESHPDFALDDLRARLGLAERAAMEGPEHVRIAVPRRMKLSGGRTWSSFTQAQSAAPRPDAVLIEALQRAHHLAIEWSGKDRSAYRRRLRRLAFLSPQIQRRLLEGTLPPGLGLKDLLASEPPLSWSQQGAWLASLAAKRG